MKKLLKYILIFFIAVCNTGYAAEDPWILLQEQFNTIETKPVLNQPDPWKKLRGVFLPFSLQEEEQAILNPVAAKTMAQKINHGLSQYESIVETASQTFKIPKVIIKAVIMAESGGDHYAKAGTTSAKGLMQTIDSTFKMARIGLAKKGIQIRDNPFDPESSIMAGAFYLDRMYKKAVKDKKIKSAKRNDVASWRYPLEYYYAGPLNGAKPENRIYVFSNGTKRVIDKRAYSKKIQKWARILAVS